MAYHERAAAGVGGRLAFFIVTLGFFTPIGLRIGAWDLSVDTMLAYFYGERFSMVSIAYPRSGPWTSFSPRGSATPMPSPTPWICRFP